MKVHFLQILDPVKWLEQAETWLSTCRFKNQHLYAVTKIQVVFQHFSKNPHYFRSSS